MFAKIYRYPEGALPNSLAFLYCFGAYGLGLALLIQPRLGWCLAGICLLTHSLTIAAYLIHELTHRTIFQSATLSDRVGDVAGWLTGSCYVPFADLRLRHMRHHLDRADMICFDYVAFLRARPVVRRCVLFLEWCWIPAVELLMHAYVMAAPFLLPERRCLRQRVAVIVLMRGLAFGALGMTSISALLGYALAYLAFLTVLRFVDAYQHTYETYYLHEPSLPVAMQRDTEYEQRNTYSNLVSRRWPWLNLLVLNFCYHNAHHYRPTTPWYALPGQHQQIADLAGGQIIPMRHLIRDFHAYRIFRVLDAETPPPGSRPGTYHGGVGLSFLTTT